MTQPINHADIPAELIALPQWVCWKYQTRNGKKPTKVPYNAKTGELAESNNPATWATYEDAVRALDTGKYAGIGYVFSPNDPYVGIDLDNCLTDGVADEWAARIIDDLRSYSEISPSGKGIKIWVKGTIPESIKTEHIEIYSQGRYFTVTGQRPEWAPKNIYEVNGALDRLCHSIKPPVETPQPTNYTTKHDKKYLEDWANRKIADAIGMVANAPDGDRHNTRIRAAKLLGGLIPRGLATAEQIESALYAAQPPQDNHKAERKTIRDAIAYGINEPLELPTEPLQPVFDDRGFVCCPTHHSRLIRTKAGDAWRCPDKYGCFYWKGEGYVIPDSQILIDSHENPNENRSLSLTPQDVIIVDKPRFFPKSRQALNDVLPPEWLLDNEIVARAYNLIYGPSGSGKTFYLIDIARRAAKLGIVVYVATEDTAGLKVRVIAQEKAHGVQLDNLLWIDEPIDLSNHKDVADFITAIRAVAPVLTIIDTLAMAHTGDENSNQDMSAVNRAIRQIINDTGSAVALVHHTGVNEGRERGATALMGNVDHKMKILNDDGLITIYQEKVRNGKPGDPRRFVLTDVDTGLVDDKNQPIISAVIRPSSQVTMRGAKITPIEREILNALAMETFVVTGAKAATIRDVVELKQATLYRKLSSLMQRGFVAQAAKGDPYFITREGKAEIAPEYVSEYEPIEGYEEGSDSQQVNADSHGFSPDSHGLSDDLSTTSDNTDSQLSRLSPPFRVINVDKWESSENRESEKTEETDPRTTIDWELVKAELRRGNIAAIHIHCALHMLAGDRPAPFETVVDMATAMIESDTT